ncbi:uncharacterized protein [Nerophis lumbriciformis]|uniref:uncharacterized protein isoform X2 n=1 Tax=Nerophis lumbriciformis TaxID=546530 RepID=UPI002AE02A66|nr:uncharacterized protein LOC133580011 isoform X2 [Nerophis lumbriciformis]
MSGKRDTPVKVAFTWQHARKRRQKCKIYETLPEEPEVEEDPDVKEDPDEKKFKGAGQTSAQSSQCQSSSTAFAQKSNILHQELSPAVTPGGAITKTTASSSSSVDDDEDDDCFSSYSSSVPSPEIFRHELYAADASHFPAVGDVADLHVQVKNSTLISSSHAESILSHQSPNVSTILVAAEKPLKTMKSPKLLPLISCCLLSCPPGSDFCARRFALKAPWWRRCMQTVACPHQPGSSTSSTSPRRRTS